MNDPTSQDVSWFRAAAPYVAAHRGERFVVAVSGEAVAHAGFISVAQDLLRLHALGVHVVLVHGVDHQLHAEAGLRPRQANGLRVTTSAQLATVQGATGALRLQIEGLLSAGIPEMMQHSPRVASGNYITARPVGVVDGVDFMSTGAVRKVDGPRLGEDLNQGGLVLLSPVGFSPTGQCFYLDTNEVAFEVARGIGAAKLLILSCHEPIVDEAERPIRELTLHQALRIKHDVASRQPDIVDNLSIAIHAAQDGIKRVHLLDARIDGALPLELFTRDGVGTMIYVDPYDETRPARADDIAGMLALIQPLEESGALVPRTAEQLELDISHFVVMERDSVLIGCAAIYPQPGATAAELACLAVHPEYRAGERGDALLRWVEERAQASGIAQLFVLTTHTTDWFRERGFTPGSMDDLPNERQATYDAHRNSRILLKWLSS